jgi:hypothetical protein
MLYARQTLADAVHFALFEAYQTMSISNSRVFWCGLGALSTIALMIGARAAATGVPSMNALSYSGSLETLEGQPLSGSKFIAFSLFDALTGGEELCRVRSTEYQLVNGRFQIALPEECASAVHANAELWVEVQVDGASLGRAKLGAVPYALEADHAVRADNSAGELAQTIEALQARLAALSCPEGFYQAGPNTCVSANEQLAAAAFYDAVNDCSAQRAHVCSWAEMQQACAARGTNGIPENFNPYADLPSGWLSDHAGADDVFFTWNASVCSSNSDGPPSVALDTTGLPGPVLSYRCCS